MSKKETEFDRYDRMKRMEREQEFQKEQQKRKYSVLFDEVKPKKAGKQRPQSDTRKNWSKELDEEED